MKQLMHSGYPRLKNDDYKTIDPRCTYALVEHINLRPFHVIDPCAPSGSGIVDTLRSIGIKASGLPSAFDSTVLGGWHVTNPPYTRGLVDDILNFHISLVREQLITGFAALMRWGFDHAANREAMFENNIYYYGQIKTLFRPVWMKKEKDKKKQPFHPFVWHIWTGFNDFPRVMYSKGELPHGYRTNAERVLQAE
jgi:hypothetical protein